MDLIIDFILSFVLETSVSFTESNRKPKWLRYLNMMILIACFSILTFGIYSFANHLVELGQTVYSIPVWIALVLMLIFIAKFIKKILSK